MMKNYQWIINKSEDYVEEHLNQKIVIDDIASFVNLSPYHFHRIFSKNSQETVNQFITRIKMERSAIFLVIRKDISITEIAQQYGYSEASSYNKAFKKHFKMSPTQFRKQQDKTSKKESV